MGFVHEDLVATVARIGYAGIRRVLADHGIGHVEVEFLSDWDADPATEARAASDRMRADLIEAAGELGARNLKASPHLFVEPPPDIARMRDAFGALCEEVRPTGANVIIEVMPFTDVRTIADGLAIVGDAPNAGLLLDIWHVERGGIALAEVAAMPAGRLLGVELDDSGPPEGDLFDDTRFRRVLPGDGTFDVAGFLRAARAGGLSAPYYGVEIIGEAYRRQPLETMARTSFQATMRQVERALTGSTEPSR
jgi:sugar phosphate isomerase/epimerase